MVQYEKLVRDRIPEILDRKGVVYTQRIAGDKEYREELIRKVVEEAHEFSEAGAVVELADIIEVVEALQRLPEYTMVQSVREQKYRDCGGFKKRIICKGEKE